MPHVSIEIWSDVVCPWCYIGKRRLETALAAFEHRDDVEVVYRSFQLDPSAPPVPDRDRRGAPRARSTAAAATAGQQMVERVEAVAAEEGLLFRLGEAQRVEHGRRPPAAAPRARARAVRPCRSALKEALLAAYFLRAENVADHDLLRRTAEKVGLDADAGRGGARRARSTPTPSSADIREAAALGATGVPFFVVDRKYGISGAQPAEVFGQVLERAWTESHPVLEQVGAAADAEACGPDGCAI